MEKVILTTWLEICRQKSTATYSQIYKMADLFIDIAASEYIMETHLYAESAKVDFSFRVLAEKEKSCLASGLKNHRCSALTRIVPGTKFG